MTRAPRCERCGEPIGVYEPLITLVDGQAREGSRAAGVNADSALERCYHSGCYAPPRDDEPPII